MSAGLFITLEGGEGSGKSTQAKHLKLRLEQAGHAVVQTREPGGSEGAEDIRALLVTGEPSRWDGMTEALLLFAARHDHLERIIKPALKAGKVVLCDRFTDSTMAYQGYGHNLGRETIEKLNAVALDGFGPDLTLILDLPVDIGLSRAMSRGDGEQRYEDMDIAFHQRLRDGFLDIAKREPDRCKVVDASGSEEAVAEKISGVVMSLLATGKACG